MSGSFRVSALAALALPFLLGACSSNPAGLDPGYIDLGDPALEFDGFVRSAVDGTPIANAVVNMYALRSDGSGAAGFRGGSRLTDADGHYQLEFFACPAQGPSVMLRAECNGRCAGWEDSSPLDVPSCQARQSFDFALQPSAAE